MNRETRRAVLEAIISADDATPGDRLRALDLLGEFERDGQPRFELEATEAEDDPNELDDLLAPIYGGERMVTDPESPLARILADVLGPGERYPGLAAAVGEAVMSRAREIAAELADEERIEREIEKRVKRRVGTEVRKALSEASRCIEKPREPETRELP